MGDWGVGLGRGNKWGGESYPLQMLLWPLQSSFGVFLLNCQLSSLQVIRTLNLGTNRVHSCCQLCRVDAGETIKKGPHIPWCYNTSQVIHFWHFRAQNLTHLSQMCHESDALYCLAKSHLISKNTIDTLVIQVGQPVHALQLVGLQLPTKYGRLRDLLVRLEHGCGQTEVLVNYTKDKSNTR